MRQLLRTLVMLTLPAAAACGGSDDERLAAEDPDAPRPVATAASPDEVPELPPQAAGSDATVSERFVLVVLGDSLSAGYDLPADAALPAQLQSLLDADEDALEIRNAGVSGDTSAMGLARFDWSVEPEADGVLVELGANDMLDGLPIDEMRANLAAIIERAQARGLWIGLVGMKAPLNADAGYRDEFDSVYPALSDAYDVPLYPYYFSGLIDPNTGESRPELFQPDGVHPTDAGVAIVADGLSAWLEDVLPAEAVEGGR